MDRKTKLGMKGLLFLFMWLNLSICGFAGSPKIPVTVSIQPQVFFLEQVGGDRVDIHLLVLPGRSPATYAPTPTQMTKLVKSKLFFRIGVPFEDHLMPKIKNIARNTKIIETQHGIPKRRLAAHHHEDEAHSDTDELHHDDNEQGNDPHIWLNPLLVKKQAETIAQAMIDIDPAGKAFYLKNLAAFQSKLDLIHQKLTKALAPIKGQRFYVFHPSFGYFADAYGIEQEAIEMEGKKPKAKDLAKFIKNAKADNIRVIFVQPQFDQSSARKIASAINGVVISLDPLSKEYFKNLEEMAKQIGSRLK